MEDRIGKLKEGHRILQDVIRSATLEKTYDVSSAGAGGGRGVGVGMA